MPRCALARTADGDLVPLPDDERAHAVRPLSFKTLAGRGHPEFSSGRQQDAAEFFTHLMELVGAKGRVYWCRRKAAAPAQCSSCRARSTAARTWRDACLLRLEHKCIAGNTPALLSSPASAPRWRARSTRSSPAWACPPPPPPPPPPPRPPPPPCRCPAASACCWRTARSATRAAPSATAPRPPRCSCCRWVWARVFASYWCRVSE